MKRTEQAIFTNMCMIYNDKGEVLVQDRVNKDYRGVTFPGGHVEKGESFTKAVIREVFEETGYHISSPQLCGIKDWINEEGSRYVVLFYKTDKFSGELKSSAEGEVFWAKLSELSDLDLAQGMEKMLKVFCDSDFSEYYFYRKEDGWAEELM